MVLVSFQWLGQLIVLWTNVIIPGPLMGMLLLLLVLIYPSDLVSLVEPVSSRLIQNLSLLFIPASVGAFFLEQKITSQLPNLLIIVILSTLLTILFMSLLIKLIRRSSDD
ncbi:CidA/LrgA family protein [Porticoccaceae bacterium]|nr:CidA/LrgA family protein [Porticoccaceae bacterium]MDB2620733.1 CidA/LrgA family protein [Porticoccaceae bacterium]MDB2669594.1 CidA/LrgA family protein [Porticoccaceae bacterium]